jgi:hypothetical protein
MRARTARPIFAVMSTRLERSLERRIRLWILEQEQDRRVEAQRRAAQSGGAREQK